MDHRAPHVSLESSLLPLVEAEAALSQVGFDVIFVPLLLPSLGALSFLQFGCTNICFGRRLLGMRMTWAVRRSWTLRCLLYYRLIDQEFGLGLDVPILENSLPQPSKGCTAPYSVVNFGVNGHHSCGKKAAKVGELIHILQKVAFHINCGGLGGCVRS